MTLKTKTLTIMAAAGFAALATVSGAQEAGQQEYMNACAVCHGENATGNGPLASLMSVPAPDLTVLAKNNEGVFPMLYVVHVIDGRTGVRAHGSDQPDWAGGMPVWGDRFATQAGTDYGPYGSELYVRGRVMALADYLEGIQQ